MDTRTGIRTITKDIRSGIMVLNTVRKLVLLIGRADFLNNEDFGWVLRQFIETLDEVQYKNQVILVGPLPASYDSPSMCKQLLQEREKDKELSRSSASCAFL